MSYEGYEQHLCANGHEFFQDAYDDDVENCPHCDAPSVWVHYVDQTNGDDGSPYTRRVTLEVKTEEQYCTCHCGNTHTIAVATYEIPKK